MLVHLAQSTVRDILPNTAQILCFGPGLGAEVVTTDLFLYHVARCIVPDDGNPSNC